MTPGRIFLGLLNHPKFCLETRDVKIIQGHEETFNISWKTPVQCTWLLIDSWNDSFMTPGKFFLGLLGSILNHPKFCSRSWSVKMAIGRQTMYPKMSHKTLNFSWKTPVVDDSWVTLEMTQSWLQEDFLRAPESPKRLVTFMKCQNDLVIGK